MFKLNLKKLSFFALFMFSAAQAEIETSYSEIQKQKESSSSTKITQPKTIEAFVSTHFCNQSSWNLFKKCAKSKRVIFFGTASVLIPPIFPLAITMLATSKCSSLFGNQDYDETGDFVYGMLFMFGLTRGFMDKKLGKDTIKFCQNFGIKTEISVIEDLINKAIEAHKKLEIENPGNKAFQKDNINIELGKNLREEIAKLKKTDVCSLKAAKKRNIAIIDK